MDATTTAGLVAAVIALVEVIKVMVGKLAPTKSSLHPEDKAARDKTREQIDAMATQIAKLVDVVDRRDDDGIPLAYVPRSLSAALTGALSQIRDLAETQRRTIELIERIERRLEARDASLKLRRALTDKGD